MTGSPNRPDERTETMRRRGFLAVLGTGAAALAGCSGESASPSTQSPDGSAAGAGTPGTEPPTTRSPGTEAPSNEPSDAGTDGPASDVATAPSWPSFGADAGNSGYRPGGTGPSEGRVAWRAIGDAPTVLCSPTVAGRTVYTGSAAKAIHAFDAVSGKRRWEFSTSSYVETAPAVSDGAVYAADSDGVVYAVTTDGEEAWTHETGHNLHSRAVGVADGTVFVGTAGTMPAVASGDTEGSRASMVLALDADSGTKKWLFEAADWFTGPAIGGGYVYVGNQTGEMFALDPASGRERWSWRPDAAGDEGGSILAPPTYHEGTLYVGVHALGRVVALDAASGTKQWETDLKAPNVKSSPAVGGGRVYVGAQGTESTDYDAPGEPTPTLTPTPTPDGGDEGPVTMPTYRPSGSVFALSASDGSIEWRHETGHDFRSSPAVVGDGVYVGGGDRMLALDRAGGDPRWHVTFGDFVYSSPAVVDGRAYIGSADGYLYCIE